MGDFQVDTSGIVELTEPVLTPRAKWSPGKIAFSGLSPFTQGYVEAALRELAEECLRWQGAEVAPAFSDLAPATLAQMIADCERLLVSKGVTDGNIHEGRNFWTLRQGGYYAAEDFPPVTITLGDDGLIYMREA